MKTADEIRNVIMSRVVELGGQPISYTVAQAMAEQLTGLRVHCQVGLDPASGPDKSVTRAEPPTLCVATFDPIEVTDGPNSREGIDVDARSATPEPPTESVEELEQRWSKMLTLKLVAREVVADRQAVEARVKKAETGHGNCLLRCGGLEKEIQQYSVKLITAEAELAEVQTQKERLADKLIVWQLRTEDAEAELKKAAGQCQTAWAQCETVTGQRNLAEAQVLALKDELARLQAIVTESNGAVDEFNAGFNAAQAGQPVTDEPDRTPHDQWCCGWYWFHREDYDRMVKELARLRTPAPDLEKREAVAKAFVMGWAGLRTNWAIGRDDGRGEAERAADVYAASIVGELPPKEGGK